MSTDLRAQVDVSLYLLWWAGWMAKKGYQSDQHRWLSPCWGACAFILIMLALIWFV
jgi:hypothetical protein